MHLQRGRWAYGLRDDYYTRSRRIRIHRNFNVCAAKVKSFVLNFAKKFQDAGCGIQDARCGMRDAGSKMQDAGCGMRDARCGMQDAGSKMQDAGCGMRGDLNKGLKD